MNKFWKWKQTSGKKKLPLSCGETKWCISQNKRNNSGRTVEAHYRISVRMVF